MNISTSTPIFLSHGYLDYVTRCCPGSDQSQGQSVWETRCRSIYYYRMFLQQSFWGAKIGPSQQVMCRECVATTYKSSATLDVVHTIKYRRPSVWNAMIHITTSSTRWGQLTTHFGIINYQSVTVSPTCTYRGRDRSTAPSCIQNMYWAISMANDTYTAALYFSFSWASEQHKVQVSFANWYSPKYIFWMHEGMVCCRAIISTSVRARLTVGSRTLLPGRIGCIYQPIRVHRVPFQTDR